MKKLFIIFIFLLLCSCQVYAQDMFNVHLWWNANTETDLAGYKVYYGFVSGPAYNGTGALEGNSPIDVGNVTTFTLHGLLKGVTYFFAVTAYNTSKLESGFSNEVCPGAYCNAKLKKPKEYLSIIVFGRMYNGYLSPIT